MGCVRPLMECLNSTYRNVTNDQEQYDNPLVASSLGTLNAQYLVTGPQTGIFFWKLELFITT